MDVIYQHHIYQMGEGGEFWVKGRYICIYMYLSEGGGLASYQTTWLCNNNVGISGVV